MTGLLLPFKKMNQRDLVDLESSLGATIFGAIPEGHRREFFNVDNDTWIWHEEWAVGNKQICERTIRYEISETQVIKVEPGPHYTHIKGKELNNFIGENGYNKVIATTNTSLYIHQKETISLPERVFYLPQPSQQFIQKYIEEYNKGNIITDVLVEYEYLLDDNGVIPYWNLKVNPKDNTITIKKVKDNYTKEELCQILEKFISFIWSEVGIHYPISLGNDAKDKFINREL